jgi:hypothetical protein
MGAYINSRAVRWRSSEFFTRETREFAGRTILLSHHQLFSAFSAIGKPDANGRRSPTNPHLLTAFNKLKADGCIEAWFWGHEHALTIYRPFAGLERGRCLGHGAVPVSIQDDIYNPLRGHTEVPDMVPNARLSPQGAVYAHGYAMLSLGEEACEVRYYQNLSGQPDLVYSELIS